MFLFSHKMSSELLTCSYCSSTFNDENNLLYHMQNVHRDRYEHKCPHCLYATHNMVEFSKHCREIHQGCNIEPDDDLITDTLNKETNPSFQISNARVKYNRKNKFDRSIYRVKAWKYKGVNDFHFAMNNMREKIKDNLREFINLDKSIPSVKYQICTYVEFARLSNIEEKTYTKTIAFFNSHLQVLFNLEGNFSTTYDQAVNKIWNSMDKYIKNGSGWIFRKINIIRLNIYRYQPFRGSSYIPTPDWVKFKRCIINIKNTDMECFKWCVLAHKFGHLVNKNSKYNSSIYDRADWINSINWEGINFPTSLLDLDTFEKNNTDWSVIVFRIDNSEKITPTIVRDSNYVYTRPYDLVLCLIVDEKTEKEHYTLVTDYHKLGKTHDGNISKLCLKCKTTFTINSKKNGKIKDLMRFENHKKECVKNNKKKITFPKKKILKFNNIKNIKRNEFNITADFECLLNHPSTTDKSYSKEELKLINSGVIQTAHNVFSVAINVVSDRFQDQFKPVSYREGKDGNKSAGYMFCELLWEIVKKINYLYETECNKTMIPLTQKQKRNHYKAKNCHICGELIKCKLNYNSWMSFMGNRILTDDESEIDKIYEPLTILGPKVFDHDHWSGLYRGPAHAFCNTQFRERGKTMKTSIFFHNGARYDNHLILQNLFKFLEDNQNSFENPTVIAKTMEHFMQIDLGPVLIKDTRNFLPESLDVLVENLKDEGRINNNMEEIFKHTYMYFNSLKQNNPNLNNDDFDLLTRKNVYPYEYMTDLSKCEETSLPSIDNFYSTLRDESISIEDYEHGKKVFERFQCKNLGDYTDLYNMTDTLLLSDVLEGLRKHHYETFKLDPVYYLSAPSMAFDSALKYTKSQFEILDTIEKSSCIDDSIIGGYSAAHVPIATANNKILTKFGGTYDESKLDSYLLYVDCNNLYGKGQRGLLAYAGLNFLTEEELKKITETFIKNLSDDGEIGYFFNVDVEYPKYLHDQIAHITLPLLPEHLEIHDTMLSDFQRETSENLTNKIGGKKVVTSLFDKNNITLHYLNLKQALNLGLKLKKVHWAMEFKQDYVLQPYVDLCTEQRKKSTNKFTKNYWKLMINSVFGKFCENLLKRRTIKLMPYDEEKFKKEVRKNGFKQGFRYLDENFAGYEVEKETICLNKPRYVGSCILNIAKYIMYDFHYNYIMKLFPNTELILTDTDSFVYHIRSNENVYDILQKSPYMDFSNYSKSSKYYDNKFHLVPGKFKDECEGFPILQTIALRSKMYSMEILKCRNDISEVEINKVAKGITKAYQKKYLDHSDYLLALKNNKPKKITQINIKSEKHRLYTMKTEKAGLSAWNDKRVIYKDKENDKYYTIPIGHYLSYSNLSDEEIIEKLKLILPSDNKNCD